MDPRNKRLELIHSASPHSVRPSVPIFQKSSKTKRSENNVRHRLWVWSGGSLMNVSHHSGYEKSVVSVGIALGGWFPSPGQTMQHLFWLGITGPANSEISRSGMNDQDAGGWQIRGAGWILGWFSHFSVLHCLFRNSLGQKLRFI